MFRLRGRGFTPRDWTFVLWLGILALSCVVCASCGGTVAVETASAGQLPATLRSEQVAIKGLTVVDGRIKVDGPAGKDRQRATRLAREGELALTVENIPMKAARHFRDAILADPSFAPAYEGLARAVRLEGDPELTKAALATALAMDQSLDRARFEQGVAAQAQGDYKGATEAWQLLLKRNPRYPDLYARLAIAHYFRNDFVTARKFLREADIRRQNVPSQFRTLLHQAEPQP